MSEEEQVRLPSNNGLEEEVADVKQVSQSPVITEIEHRGNNHPTTTEHDLPASAFTPNTHRTFIERYFSRHTVGDLELLTHFNGVVILCLTQDFIRRHGVKSFSWTVGRTNRMESSKRVKKARKKGGLYLKVGDYLCQITSTSDEVIKVPTPIAGQVLECNDRLEGNPLLLTEQGFLAIVLPPTKRKGVWPGYKSNENDQSQNIVGSTSNIESDRIDDSTKLKTEEMILVASHDLGREGDTLKRMREDDSNFVDPMLVDGQQVDLPPKSRRRHE